MNGSAVRVEVNRHTSLYLGSPRVLMPVFKALGVRRQWDGRRKGWHVSNRVSDDVMAALEERRVAIDIDRSGR